MGAAAKAYPNGLPPPGPRRDKAADALKRHGEGLEAALNKKFPVGSKPTSNEVIDFVTKEYASKFRPPAGTSSWNRRT